MQKYNVIVMSDEVHGDIIMPDQTYIPSLALKKYQNNVIAISAVSKTFSLAIYSHSHILCPNNKFRKKIDEYQNKHHLGKPNAFNCLPTYYGYKYGAEWLKQVNNLIFENYKYIKTELSELEMTNLEGTYLLFVNFKGYNNEKSAASCLMKNCHIFANAGETFGKGYNNWVRLNLATSKENIIKAVKEIKTFINK
jgi:Bifunctional PLP-dependent enzyme with beta-cystathionase and maltose regulon repressor activities